MATHPYPTSFPASPAIGDTYQEAASETIFVYGNTGWVRQVIHRASVNTGLQAWPCQITHAN